MTIKIKQLCEFLFDAGIDQYIIDNISNNSNKVYLDYDLSNELDLQILGNKISAISEKTIASENVYDKYLLNWIFQILQTKY